MTLAGPRTETRGALVNTTPVTTPDVEDGRLMTRRGWWLVVLNFLIPGSAQAVAGSRRLGKVGLGATLVLWTLAVIAVATLLLWRHGFVSIVSHGVTLFVLAILAAAYAILWVVLSLDTLRLVRLVRTQAPKRFFIGLLAILLTVVQAAFGFFATSSLFTAAATSSDLFGRGAPVVPPSDGYYNVLLLGADSGDGRDSMRFDSISVISINADTGAVTITGIPRDLQHAPFSEGSPMLADYPNGYFEGRSDPSCGWDSGVNQLTNAVSACREDGGASIYPDAERQGSTPAIEATKDLAEGLLGIEIPYYVSIDMHGFAALIDALGGVDIDVAERLPEGPGPAYDGQPADEWATGWIEAGPQRMDGETALWYARSRYTTSDWDRMQRQRILQQAVLDQVTPQNLLTRFQDVASAGTDVITTDVPQGLVSTFLDLAVASRDHEMASLELTPDAGVDQEWPDAAQVHELVRGALHPESDSSDE
ncbi:LCP family protein [Microbacterium sp. gxy059]|uniref:LCP family protein n=1 Tax=Microbacterium sp. gxy059 TaxID=2957199 RepID=UPI003D9538C6